MGQEKINFIYRTIIYYYKKYLTMKSLFLYLLSVLAVATIIISCVDTPERDPYEYRKSHHKHFRCKVNGKEWTYTTAKFLAPPTLTGAFEERTGTFSIEVTKKDSKESSHIDVFKGSNLKEGDNILYYSNFNNHRPKPSNIFKLDTTYNSNNLFIKDIDTTKHIITGTFEFRAITDDKIDTIMITDGEFDFYVPNWYPN